MKLPSVLRRREHRGPAADAAVCAPGGIEVAPGHLRVGDGFAATLIVTGYPAEVGPAWLDPILSWPGRLDVALHIEPLPAAAAAGHLRRQRARLESARRADADAGRLADPLADAAAGDAAALADRVARGQSMLFRVGLYLTVHAVTLDELRDHVAQVRAAAASVLIDSQPATWRQLQGWTSTLPLATDSIGMTRIMDTQALAAAFPLGSADLPAPLPGEGAETGGVLYGVNTDSPGVVWWDRWRQHNHNSVVLARSGAGKSYFVKLEILRSLADGVRVAVVDPEDEYGRLAAAVGGVTVRLGAPGVRVNPLQVPARDTRPDALTRRALFVITFIAVLLGRPLTAQDKTALDAAIARAYAAAGVNNDPATWTRPAPLLGDVARQLAGVPGDDGPRLAAELLPWTTGSFRDLFEGPTTTPPAGQLVVWSTRQLAEEVRAAGLMLALSDVGLDVELNDGDGVRRLVIVDEAWTLLRDSEGADFLITLARRARKRNAGLAVVTQDAADLLSTPLGHTIVTNAATQVLMRQSPQAIDAVMAAFDLTAGEGRVLLSAQRGQGLLLAGSHRVTFQAVASRAEHQLCVTGLEFDASNG